MLQIPLKIIDLQTDFNILVAKQWKIKISVPMSYITLFKNLAVLEKSSIASEQDDAESISSLDNFRLTE